MYIVEIFTEYELTDGTRPSIELEYNSLESALKTTLDSVEQGYEVRIYKTETNLFN